MSILLETTFGDIVLDLDVDGSPALCKNILKLTKARYYTNTLIYNIVPGKYAQMGDPKGDGTGGCSIHGLIDSYQSSLKFSNKNNKTPPDVTQSQRRFLQSHGRHLSPDELNQKGIVIAMEIGNVPHTIGSQFLFTLSENNGLKDLMSADGDGGNDGNGNARYLSLGTVSEDSQNILSKLDRAYCDDDGRPFADIRIQRALVLHDPFEDPAGMEDLLKIRGVTAIEGNGDNNLEKDLIEGYPLAPKSPTYDRPPEEAVPVRIQADDTTLFATAGWDDNDASREYEDEDEEDEAARQKRLELQEKQEEEWRQRQDTSRAVMLEMLGDRPTADVKAPENVLFVCKLNPLTGDEDLELIFSRFDQEAKAEIIRDPDTGASLQYAFVEFKSNEACNEAYLKMNNALVDDRRIRVDFSQSVANVWDRYNKKYRMGDRSSGIDRGFVDGGGRNGGGRGRGRGSGRGSGPGPGRGNRGGNNPSNPRARGNMDNRPNGQQRNNQPTSRNDRQERREESEFDSFGRKVQPRNADNNGQGRNHHPRDRSRSRSPSRDIDIEERRRRSDRDRSSRRSRSRSRSDDLSDDSRRRKKNRKHRHRDSSRRKRSRSHERERKHHKKHHRRSRENSDDDDERRKKHHRRREHSDDDERRDRKNDRRRHGGDDDNHHRRRGDRSRSR